MLDDVNVIGELDKQILCSFCQMVVVPALMDSTVRQSKM